MDVIRQVEAAFRAKHSSEKYPDGKGIHPSHVAEAAIREKAARFSGSVTWRLLVEVQHTRILAQEDPQKLREELLEGAALLLRWADTLK